MFHGALARWNRTGGEALSGAGEQRAERRRVIVSAAAVDVRLADQLDGWQPRQVHALTRQVSLIGVPQCNRGPRKAESAPATGMDERQKALEAQHALERLRRKTDSCFEATTQLALRHPQRGSNRRDPGCSNRQPSNA